MAQGNGRGPTGGAFDQGDEDDEDDTLAEERFDPEEYDVMLRLEQFESVEEEMMELGVTTLEEVRQRIAELHREIERTEKQK